MRDVQISATKTDAKHPVRNCPFRVTYYHDTFMFFIINPEFRTPHDVGGATDFQGKAIVKLADYWAFSFLTLWPETNHSATFPLNRQLVRQGGTVNSSESARPEGGYRLVLTPLKRPN
jgi:hypothetical protein